MGNARSYRSAGGLGLRRAGTGGGLRGIGLLCCLALLALLAGPVSASAAAPPELTGLTLSPSAINTSSSSQTVKVAAQITSSVGASGGSVAFESPNGSQTTERVSFSKISGTEWQASVPFKQYIAGGSWTVRSIDLSDTAGSTARFSSTQLQEKGFEHTVVVTSTEDNEPPVLASMSFSSSKVNTISASQTVTVSAHITDNLSGFTSGYIIFRSPNGKQSTGKTFFTNVSGSGTDGTYEAKVTFNRFIAPGPWKATVHLGDNVGNEINLTTRRLQSKGFPEMIQVESVEDEAPPALAGLSISSSAVNTTSSSQTVTVMAHITDDKSGVAIGSIVFESPNGKQATARAAFSKVTGTETDGTYEASVTFEQFIQAGSWKVRDLNLQDNVGNETDLSAAQLQAKGFPATVNVVSTEDTQAPALATFSIAPSTVKTMTSPQVVTVTAEITDNLSGFSHGSVVFESPNKKVISGVVSFAKVSGTAVKGLYEAKVTFKQYIQAGSWKISNVNLVDGVGNEANISATQLGEKGFPSTVTVESNEDKEAPTLAGLTINPTTINTATSNQIVIVTAHIKDNLSGFQIGAISFESQNGKHGTGQALFSARLSGTETDGTYEAVVNFKQTPESGMWTVKEVFLADAAGNEVAYSATQLGEKGFPFSVLDETGGPPTVKKLSPRKGPAAGGTSVTITGSNFNEVTSVKFGSKEAIGFTVSSINKIVATSPEGTTGFVDVTVTTTNGTSVISSHDHFKYLSPTVTDVSPNHGPQAGGTEVTITGTGFEVGSGTVIKFAQVLATSVHCSSRTSCTAVSPRGSSVGSVHVTVTVAGKRSARTTADRFTYT